jgi:DNA polymerase-3 subunit epsilon
MRAASLFDGFSLDFAMSETTGLGNHDRRDAERIHHFSGSALHLQDPFAVHAADVWRFLTSYISRRPQRRIRPHFHRSRDEILRPARAHQACLLHLKGYRSLELGGSASLSAVCRHIKLACSGDLHGAIEDAWLAMQIYLWLHGCPLQRRLRRSLPRTPSNFRHPRTRPYRDQQGLRRSGVP